MRPRPHLFVVPLVMSVMIGPARATDIPITGRKLIVVDKTGAASSDMVVFVAKDTAIMKGTGTDPAQIEARLEVAYDSAAGAFIVPQGPNWFVNSSRGKSCTNSTGQFATADGPKASRCRGFGGPGL